MSIWIKFLLVVGSGGLGSLCRYLVVLALNAHGSWMGLPAWVVNVVGCFITGLCAGWLLISPGSAEHRELLSLVVITGFCGGFSTFSAFTLDCVKYFESGHIGIWVIFGTATIFCGLLSCAVGYWLGTKL